MSATRRRLTALLAAFLAVGLMALTLSALASPAAGTVKAAVVNNDQMVKINGQTMPMGRQLAAELVQQNSRFDWEITTPELAETGLRNGTYAVVVSIPEEFSQDVTSLSGATSTTSKTDSAVKQGMITVEAKPGATADEKYAIESVTRAATTALGSQISDAFVTSLIGGLGEMQTQIGEAAQGASQLVDGTSKTGGGITQLDQGASQLADGTSSAAEGLSQLDDGANQLANGASAAATGMDQLVDGTSNLVSGLSDAATGAQTLADKTQDLATGLTQLADGGTQVSTLVDQGIDAFGTQMGAGVSDFVTSNNGYIENAAKPTAQALQGTVLAISRFCDTIDPANTAQQQFCTQFSLQQLTDMGTAAAATLGNADAIIAGGTALSDGVSPAVDQLKQGVNSGITSYSDQVRTAATGAGQLADGSQQFATQLGSSGTQAQALVDGAQQAADGVSQLALGADQLADGTGQAADGLSQLSTGASQLADGTSQLKSGSGQLSSGVSQLADGLLQAADQIPSFNDEQMSQLVTGITAPVATPTVISQGSTALSAQAVAAFVAILWLATFALALVFPAFASHLVESVRPSLSLAFEAWWSPAAWAAVVGAVGGLVVGRWADTGGSTLAALVLLGAVAGAVFYGVNQALTASLGSAGRVIGIGVFGVALSVAFAPVGTGALGSLSALLPTGLTTTVLEALVVPGTASAARALVGLLAWGGAAFALTIWATSRRRAKPGVLTRGAAA